jgi:hypothetical protein
MNRKKYYRNAGYKQGFEDGKITRGKVNKKYIEYLFKSETQTLTDQESLQYKNGWQDGFIDAVRESIKSQVLQEDCVIRHLDKIFGIV